MMEPREIVVVELAKPAPSCSAALRPLGLPSVLLMLFVRACF